MDAATPIKISVVVATYNPGSHIDDLVASVLAQTMPADEFEVIFADDDSTDGTLDRLRALESEHEHFRVLHNTPNSGWPGRPRNLGVDAARGEFVYFMDNDDWLETESLDRLYAYAIENDSDIVFGRVVGVNRAVGREVFRHNVADADIVADGLLRLLTPHKLFRTSMLREHDIRFPEGRVRLEDHLFVMKAYFAAKRISILADYPCYHWVNRGSNASFEQPDPDMYFDAVRAVLEVVAANTEPGEFRNRVLVHWYGGKALLRLEGKWMSQYTDDYRRALFDTIRTLTADWFPPEVDEFLPARRRIASALLRRGDLDALTRFATWQAGLHSTASLRRCAWQGDRLHLDIECALVDATGSPVEVSRTGKSIHLVLPPELELGDLDDFARSVTRRYADSRLVLLARNRSTKVVEMLETYPADMAAFDGEGRAPLRTAVRTVVDPADIATWKTTDLIARFVTSGWGFEARPAVPEDMDLTALVREFGERRLMPYPTTDFGNLSLKWRKKPAPKPPPPPPPSLPRRAARSARRRLRALRAR